VTLIERARGRVGAFPVRCGAYRTHPHMLVRHKGPGMDSGVGGETLKEGSFIEIVETRYLSSQNVVRGKVASGGWITLIDCTSDYRFAIPVDVGVYVCARKEGHPVHGSIAPPSGSHEGLDVGSGNGGGGSSVTGLIKRYAFMEVVETKYLPSSGLVRARLVHGGWVTLVVTYQAAAAGSTSTRRRRSLGGSGGVKPLPPKETAKPIKTGTYLTVVDPLVVTVGAGLETKKMGDVKAGRLVEVVEIRYIWGDDRVRGRVSGGGWITLVNGEDRKNYAKMFGK